MQKSRIRYIFTWVSLVILLICSILLIASAWNSRIIAPVSPSVLSLYWVGISASGIYLFLLAVKKAHRQWIDEMREQEREADEAGKSSSRHAASSREKKTLDFAGTARKIVRRVPENIDQEELGKLLLRSLARELEIMSGIYYVEKKGKFTVQASYAMSSGSEDYSFQTGEGLPGQAARNQQPMVLNRLPEGYLEVFSGLGKAPPSYLAIVPLVHKGKTTAVLECSGYKYEPEEIEKMFRIFTRELMNKLSPKPS